MAISRKGHPRVVVGKLQATKLRATDSQTWRAGAWGTLTSGLSTLVASNATNVKHVVLQDQTTSTATSDVWVANIPSGENIEFEMYGCTSTSDTTLARSNLGVPYAITVSNSSTMVDKGDTTNDCVEIMDLGWIYEPYKNASTDSPARCKARILQAVLDA